MNLLVTGGAGFIGSNLVHHWVDAHPDDTVVVVDALTYAGNRANLDAVADRITFIEADICDTARMTEALTDHDIDAIVHVAAESHNSLAVADPTLFFSTNVMGTQSMLEAARATGDIRFHHISTCEVYGELALDDTHAFTEESPYRPRTPYNASKAAADHAVRAYHETFGLPITISNCANNYGPYQFPEKVLPLFITNALDDQPLPMYESTANRREWIHVDDHVRGIERVLLEGTVGRTYHIGTGFEASIEQIADAVIEATGKDASLKTTVADRPGHDVRYLLDSERIRAELNWSPSIDFHDGLVETVRWYTEHRDWWEPLKARAPIDERTWGPSG